MSISAFGRNRAVIDTSHIGLAAGSEMTSIPDDLIEVEELEFTYQYNPNTQLPVTAAPETITLTFPVPTGSSNGATMAGTAFVTHDGLPEIAVGTLMIARGRIKFNGLTGPTFTDAS